eukprot:Gb_02756 [translate_table: standard]
MNQGGNPLSGDVVSRTLQSPLNWALVKRQQVMFNHIVKLAIQQASLNIFLHIGLLYYDLIRLATIVGIVAEAPHLISITEQSIDQLTATGALSLGSCLEGLKDKNLRCWQADNFNYGEVESNSLLRQIGNTPHSSSFIKTIILFGLLIAQYLMVDLPIRNIDCSMSNSIILKDGATLLHYAVQVAAIQTVKLLLKHNVDVNVADNEGWTPLHLAVQSRTRDIVKILLKNGADKTVRNKCMSRNQVADGPSLPGSSYWP